MRWHPHDVVAGKLAPFLGPCTAQTVRCSNARDLGSKTNPCCLSHIYHIFAEMDRILADAGILWWLDYGSALGALRDGKVIPHDKDGDAGLLGDQWPAFLALEDRVLAAGLHWWHKPNAHRGRFSGGHMVKIRLSPRNHTNVDFFPWYPNGKGELDRQSYIGIDRFKGRERYFRLVELLREVGVDTPEDDYPVFGDVTVAPLFTLYDYSFRPPGLSVPEALEGARNARAMLDDELFIAPYVDIPAWCAERVAYSRGRLSSIEGPTLLVNHWPLVVEPTLRLAKQEMALWCGTAATRDLPVEHDAVGVIHGHLHMPEEIRVDGVPHFDVSLGYPFEQERMPRRAWPLPALKIR